LSKTFPKCKLNVEENPQGETEEPNKIKSTILQRAQRLGDNLKQKNKITGPSIELTTSFRDLR
jgi:hypothetical protein